MVITDWLQHVRDYPLVNQAVAMVTTLADDPAKKYATSWSILMMAAE